MTDAIELRMRARRLGLAATEEFWAFADQDALNRLYNGFGPDRWPETLRSAMTWIYRNYEESALPHDFDFTFSDGTIAGWLAADARLIANMLKQRDALYPLAKFWLWPARAVSAAKIKAAKIALELAGYQAYYEAFLRRQANAKAACA